MKDCRLSHAESEPAARLLSPGAAGRAVAGRRPPSMASMVSSSQSIEARSRAMAPSNAASLKRRVRRGRVASSANAPTSAAQVLEPRLVGAPLAGQVLNDLVVGQRRREEHLEQERVSWRRERRGRGDPTLEDSGARGGQPVDLAVRPADLPRASAGDQPSRTAAARACGRSAPDRQSRRPPPACRSSGSSGRSQSAARPARNPMIAASSDIPAPPKNRYSDRTYSREVLYSLQDSS